MTEDNSHAGQGAVLLDIGGDVGALVVTMPAAMEGIEVEIRPVGAAEPAVAAGHDATAPAHTHADDHTHTHDPADDHSHADAHNHGDDHDHSPGYQSHGDHDLGDHDQGDHDHGDHDHDHGHGHASPWPHVAVVARPAPIGIVHSLVYPQLQEGSYELYVRPHGPVELTVDVAGGHVTEADWPTPIGT